MMIRYWLGLLFILMLHLQGFSDGVKKSCQECHVKETQLWQGSFHQKAMILASPESVLGDFSGANIQVGNAKGRFWITEGIYYCETENEKGELQTYRISHVFGWAPLQQYLVQMAPGEPVANALPKTQTLPWTWDLEKHRWYHMYEHDMPTPGEPIHWTGWGQNWNHMCADCHVTHYDKGFDSAAMKYKSTMTLDHVSCLACHAEKDCLKSTAGALPKANPIQLPYIPTFNSHLQSKEIQNCAPCHSFREQIKGKFRPGATYEDHYALGGLSADLYHHDGQIKEEVYEMGSFTQSKMFQKGVRCSNCHDPHSLKLRLPQQKVCSQCHLPEVYESEKHHHHKVDGAGANCLECHMPESIYMGIDRRRDHSIRNPRPDLSQKLGSPNACTGCHLESKKQRQEAEYQNFLKKVVAGDLELGARIKAVDDEMTKAFVKWYPKDRPEHYGEIFEAGRRGNPAAVPKLIRIAADQENYTPIIRATALDILGMMGQPTPKVLEEKIAGEDILVRRALISSMTDLASLIAMTKDPVGSVRLAALRQLLSLSSTQESGVSASVLQCFKDCEADLREYVLVNGDQGGAHVLWAQVQLIMGNIDEAINSYRKSIQCQPELSGPRATLANLLENTGKKDEARVLLKEEVDILKRDIALAPSRSDILYRLGLIHYRLGDHLNTMAVMKEVLRLQPNHYQAGAFVIQLSERYRRWDDMKDAAQILSRSYPNDPWLIQILQGFTTKSAPSPKGQP